MSRGWGYGPSQGQGGAGGGPGPTTSGLDVVLTNLNTTGGTNIVLSAGDRIETSPAGPIFLDGAGTPEGAVVAVVGSLYLRTDGAAGTTIYTKQSGVGNAGWSALVAGGGESLDATLAIGNAYTQTMEQGVGGSITSLAGAGAGAGTTLSVLAGAGGATGTGGSATVRAGTGGNTSGNGGVASLIGGSSVASVGGQARVTGGPGAGVNAGGIVRITGGTGGATSGVGGDVDINAGQAIAGNANGGALDFDAGSGNGSGAGGLARMDGGPGGATGNAGQAQLHGGVAGTNGIGGTVGLFGSSGNGTGGGGAIQLAAGAGGSTSGFGGGITATAGNAGGTNTGGSITINAGQGGNTGATVGGGVEIFAGASGTGAGSDGGVIALTGGGGQGTGASDGGGVTLDGGQAGGTNGEGGPITITSGRGANDNGSGTIRLVTANGAGTNSASGNVQLSTGTSLGTSTTGLISLTTGIPGGSGTAGVITLGTAGTTRLTVQADGSLLLAAAASINNGAGTPEGAVTAAIGSTFHRTDGGAGTSLYVKESGAGNTGWVAVAAGGGTWAATLAAGVASGANNPQIDTGQFLLGQTGLDLRTTGLADLTLRTGATARITVFGADGHVEMPRWLRVGGTATSVANAAGDFAAGDSARFLHYDASLNGGTLRLEAGTNSFVTMNGAGYIEGHTETAVTNSPVTVAQTSLRSTGTTADGFGLQIRHQIEGLAAGQINAAILRTTWDNRAGMDAFYDIKVAGNGGGAGGADSVTLALRCRGVDLVVEALGGLEVSGTAARILSGTGTPEAAVTAAIGSLYMRTDGGAGTSLYVKESGAGNTGWVGK